MSDLCLLLCCQGQGQASEGNAMNDHEMVSYWGCLDERASGSRRAQDEDVNAYGMSLASERQEAMRWKRR